jgi:sugar phosphate isomerase/epimerase
MIRKLWLTAVAMTALAGAAQAADRTCLALPESRVGLQLFSVRTEMAEPQAPPAPGAPRAPLVGDPAKLERAFAALQAMGWRNVENFGGNWGLGDAGYRQLVDRHDLHAMAAHESLSADQWPAALERAKALGQTYVGSGGYGQPGLDTLEHVLETAANLDRMGAEARVQGLKLYVHSHQAEFKNRFPYDLNGDGRPEQATAWEIVAAKTDPRNVTFEVDIHWARVALGLDRLDDLLAFLRAHRDRISLLHVKDTGTDGAYTDLGAGTTDWKRVLDAAGPQIAYYFWELDQTPAPMASARTAHRYLTCH